MPAYLRKAGRGCYDSIAIASPFQPNLRYVSTFKLCVVSHDVDELVRPSVNLEAAQMRAFRQACGVTED